MQEPTDKVDDLAHQVIGAAIEVHRILGPGFLESVYEEALAIEFTLRNIPFERQKPIVLQFKGRTVGDSRLDFLEPIPKPSAERGTGTFCSEDSAK